MKKVFAAIVAALSLLGIMSLFSTKQKSTVDTTKLQVVKVDVEEMALAPQWVSGG